MVGISLADVLRVGQRRDAGRDDGLELKAARARLRTYRSSLSRLSADDRRAVFAYDGPEVAGEMDAAVRAR
jgi:hypothetical protein